MPTTTSGTDLSDFVFDALGVPSRGADESEAQVGSLSTGSEFSTTERSVEQLIPALGQQIRVSVRAGSGVPLVLCNGIGVSLEMLDPLVDALDPDSTVIRFDVPGIGGSSDSPVPYNLPYLATVAGQLLSALGLGDDDVDVLGLSWGVPWRSNSPSRTHVAAGG
jgi:pimeloyl-ACP methyl ester carboxylesterase